MKSTYYPITLCCALLFSCSSGTQEDPKPAVDTSQTLQEPPDTALYTADHNLRFKFDFTVANIPSPAEVVNDMASYKLNYSSAYLSDISKAKEYKSDFAKAINLGIYNMDMAYAIANAQGNDVLKYLKTAMVEIDALGMKAAFDQLIGKRTETNINNRDSLLSILDEMYVRGDSYLRTNQRIETATYIFIGSWIEALHLVCITGANEKDAIQKARIHKHLWDQRLYLKNILGLLEELKNNKDASDLAKDLDVVYKEIDAIPSASGIKDKNFKSISEKVEVIRSKLTGN